jgi:hypothetical protein
VGITIRSRCAPSVLLLACNLLSWGLEYAMEQSRRKRGSEVERALRLAEVVPNEALRQELLDIAEQLSAESAEEKHAGEPTD